MRLRDWLQVTEILGLRVVIWAKDQFEHNEDEPLWAGSSLDVPWYFAEMKIAEGLDDGEPAISFRHSLGKKYDNKMGFVIVLEEYR